MSKTTYVTIRIDYEEEWGQHDENEVADLVVERANYHNHTRCDGISIENVENCGISQ